MPDSTPDQEPPPAADSTDAAGSVTDAARSVAHRHQHHHGHGHRRHRVSRKIYRRRRRVVWLLIGACGVVLLCAAWVGFRMWQARGHLEQASTLVSQLEHQLKAGDATAARTTLHELQLQTGSARSEAHDALWSAGQALPWAGPNLAAVQLMADSVDDLAWKTLPPLVDVATGLSPAQLAPKNGTIDVAALQQAAPDVVAADAAIRQVQAQVDGIDEEGLLAPVANAVAELRSKLDRAGQLTVTASRAAQLLPPMLGADGKRTYLVVFQNLAELRATGGIFGAYAVITADHGRITMAKHGSTAVLLNSFPQPVAPLSAEEVNLYTQRPAIFPADVNLGPNFPTAATLIRTMFQRSTGITVDGVIATDPVALSRILQGTGPIALPSGPHLTADNAVHYLLAQAYADAGTPAESRAVFQQAAEAVFGALMAGQGNAPAVLDGLEKAASQRRLLVWSANEREESLLAGTVLGGVLPTNDGASPTVGVYLDDGTGGKMDYYLHQTATLAATGCHTDGRMQLSVTVTLHSTAPSSGLPAYVTGMELGGPYVTRTNVLLFTPTGGSIVSVQQDGHPANIGTGSERNRTVGTLTVDLNPGQSTTIHAVITTAPLSSAPNELQLLTTPMASPTPIKIGEPQHCRVVVK